MADVRFRGITHLCITVCFLISLFAFGYGLDLSCIEVKKEYVKMGFRDDNIPISQISGDHLQICPRGNTCCTPDMESKLKSLSMKEYESVANEAFKYMKSTFISKTRKFDDFFTELLDNSKKGLHTMFVRTYGLIYQENSQVFSDLFVDLKTYYKGGSQSLVDILQKFFIELLQKLFKLVNTQYILNDEYLSCVTRHMDDLKPFGDVPHKLKLQVNRAFIAARTFVQGLAMGRDVILAMEKIKPTEACTRGMTRMMFCPYCRGLTRTKPCNNFCLNTMKGCLAHHSELNKAWNDYIEALKMVALRLEGPFNIERVVDPIKVKISDAIMNFQESSTTITDRIFEGCGTPRRSTTGVRKKRDEYTSYEDYAFGRDFIGNSGKKNSGEQITNLDKLVRDIKEQVQAAKDFWVHLPRAICNGDIAAQPGEDEDCWNGQDRARYVHEVQKDGRLHQVNNPEVTVDVDDDNGIISLQIHNLKLITGKLHNAYNGVEVEWHKDIEIDGSGGGGGGGAGGDDEIDAGSGDGSGADDLESGSGSGAQPDDEDSRPVTRRPPHLHNKNNKYDNTNGNEFFEPPYHNNNNPKYDVNRRRPTPSRPTDDKKQTDSSGIVSWSSLLLFVCLLVCVLVL